jgi:hypothetical protein
MLGRMRLFVQSLLDQTRRHRTRAELIIVEWNPPGDRPPLREVLPRPGTEDCLSLRYIVVPGSVHRRYRRAQDIPLFQMIAKNVGIRRATGSFVLCTNVDILFSDALFHVMTRSVLREDTYYRANRCDVPDGIDLAWDPARRLSWCEKNVIRRLGRDSQYRYINLELVGLQGKAPAKKWLFDKMALCMRAFWSKERIEFYQLDTYACGDFTLMSRKAWDRIGGYLELDLYSLHIDSLALIAARSAGYAQRVFPPEACVYHIDHPAGWEALSPLEKIRFLEARPAIDYGTVYELGLQCLRNGKGIELNPPTWGFADMLFPEHSFVPKDVRAAAVGGA